MVFRSGTGAVTIVATGMIAAGAGLTAIETDGENLTNCAGVRPWACEEDEKAQIAANNQATFRSRLKESALCAAIMNQAYSDDTAMATHRRSSSRTGPKSGRNVLRMETIHLMDFSYSMHPHLIVKAGLPALTDTESKALGMKA